MEISQIPNEFLDYMKELLKDDYSAFYNYLKSEDIRKSVTINKSLKEAEIMALESAGFEKIDMLKFGYFIPNDFRIGKSILSHAGAIYSQDSSAMIPAELLDVQPGDFVLDLCAAPGGKSVQILNKLGKNGLLVSNEIDYQRCKILFENITRMGFGNVVITNSAPSDFKKSGLVFDKILVDAPCSGEGLFSKSKLPIDWKSSYIIPNSKRQLDILNSVKNCLKDGGTLVYSTCTFNVEENEKVVVNFLKDNPNFSLIKPPTMFLKKLDEGIKIENYSTNLCLRCYPHKNNGAGQFVAILKKNGDNVAEEKIKKIKPNLLLKEQKIVDEFLSKNLNLDCKAFQFFKKNKTIYILTSGRDFSGLNVMCNGSVLGEIDNAILKPNHSFFKVFGEFFKNQIELDEESAKKYVHGEQLQISDGIKGYGVFKYLGLNLGGFKANNGNANNLYPKQLRD